MLYLVQKRPSLVSLSWEYPQRIPVVLAGAGGRNFEVFKICINEQFARVRELAGLREQ